MGWGGCGDECEDAPGLSASVPVVGWRSDYWSRQRGDIGNFTYWPQRRLIKPSWAPDDPASFEAPLARGTSFRMLSGRLRVLADEMHGETLTKRSGRAAIAEGWDDGRHFSEDSSRHIVKRSGPVDRLEVSEDRCLDRDFWSVRDTGRALLPGATRSLSTGQAKLVVTSGAFP
jgi:hypothetical protein